MIATWCALVLCVAALIPAWFAVVEIEGYAAYLPMLALLLWLVLAGLVQAMVADRARGLVVNSLLLGGLFWWVLLPISLPLALLAILVLVLPQRRWVAWTLVILALLLVGTLWTHRTIEAELFVALALPEDWRPRAHASLLSALVVVYAIEREYRFASSR
jgi:hypothetical protein